MYHLQCAMEENCLAPEAYRLRRENPNFSLETRRLLRFTTSIANIGNADFRPFIPKSHWQWHACHMHYHSMEVSDIKKEREPLKAYAAVLGTLIKQDVDSISIIPFPFRC